jgi:hypothetical protein
LERSQLKEEAAVVVIRKVEKVLVTAAVVCLGTIIVIDIGRVGEFVSRR